ncbi:TPA: tyrosine--tRNA ligase [archaeon]|uniref:Tyrosyl-tRNA synthetase n=1 Tax=Candidatus Naiadarchaeum limnaeum TaxID=2756139 RepID=A0A832VA31_9ARCH|nr:tyrosine--tRNA ligase [Candidatus Naiadarchaeales archaeon SRR2090153.bin1042]HIK00346.1 tyrosine--tRNA ligase [Candidatus Naiadarchaeum limnaeum]
MDIEKRIELITREPIEEVITQEDLRKLLQTKDKPWAYDGFEPSGLLHLGSGILRAIKIQDLLDAKLGFILWIADWFAWINNKMGGDLNLIQKAGEYMIEGWKACGVDTKKLKVLWTSDAADDKEYWKGVLEVAKQTTIQRTIRAGTIMGREEKEMLYDAQIFYPCMQAYDPFYFNADILQLGMDQRKVMVLSREIAPKLKRTPPVICAHHLLIGLQGAEAGRMTADVKMSKSVPKGTIYIHDSKKEIEEKINSAFCPEKVVEGNPLLEIWRYIVFRKFDSRTIERPQKFGGNLELQSYGELENIYKEGKLHPMDLKKGTIEALDEILAPARKHFEKGKAKELYEIVKRAEITR